MSNRYSFGRTTRLRYSWLLLVALLFSKGAWSQIAGYSFTESTETYVAVTGTNSTATGDDGSQNGVAIGFTFNYAGTNYTTISINTNGVLRLGANIGSSPWTNGITLAAHRPAIAPFWDDNNLNTGTITYATTGTAPNRIFEVGWNNVNIGGGGSTSATNLASFKVRLYETTNVIEFIYGPTMAAAGALSASVGLNDAAGGYISVTPNTTSTVSSSTANDAVSSTANLVGKKFIFAPPAACSTVTSGGTGTSTSTTPCYGASFTLNATGSATNTTAGVTYQWYSSPDDVTYNPIGGATSATLVTSATVPTYYRRATICAAGPSELNSTSVLVTPAAALTAPWSENFNSLVTVGTNNFPSCWFEQNGDWTSGNAASHTYNDPRGGTGNYIYNSWSATNEFIWTPAFSLTGGTSYDFSTWMVTDGLAGWTDAGLFVNTVANGSGATQLGALVTGATNTSYTEIKRTFVPSSTGVYFFGVRVNATSNPFYIGFDDFSLNLTPSCVAPTALNASAVTNNSATLGWTAGGSETVWNLEWGTTGFTQGTGTTVNGLTSNSYGITGLTGNTGYAFYVQSDCSGDLSPWSGPFTFTTLCDPISTFPSSEGFASYLPSCWFEATGGVSDPITVTPGTNAWGGSLFGNTGSNNGFKINLYGTNNAWVVSPQYDLSSGNKRLKFDYAVTSYNGTGAQTTLGTHAVRLFISTDGGTSWSAANVLQTLTGAGTYSNTGTTSIIDLSAYTTTVRFAFVATTTSFSPDIDFHIDNVVVEDIPACPNPTAGAASNVTASSADLTWTEAGSASNWDIEYGPTGFTLGTGILVEDILSLPYTLSGLSANTAYQVYYRADCGSGVSPWSGPIAFTTAPGCGSSFTDPGGAGNYPNGANYLVTICPDNVGDVVTVSFTSFATESGWDGLVVYNGPNTSSPIISSGLPAGSGSGAPAGSFYGTTSPGTVTSTDPSGCLTFWFRADGFGNDAGWESTISCGPAPTCGAPSVSGLTPSFNAVSFTINASATGTPAGFEYEIVGDGVTPTGTGTASASNAITATGLTPETAYDLYVRTDCGVTDGFSVWVGPISFTTNPAPPANDDCADAITISCASTPVLGTTLNSTVDANYIDAGATGTNLTERGVWYEIVGDDNQYTITTCDPEGLVGYDTRLTVYSGSCGALVPITGNDDMTPSCGTGSFRSQVTFGAFAGTTYYVFVHGYQFGTGLSTTGNFELNITCSALCIPEANNACASAVALTPATTCNYTTGDTECSTNTPGLANPAGVSTFATYNDVWYTIQATTSDFYLNFDYGTATNLRYTVYVGSCGSFVETPVNGIAPDATDLGIFGATVGETYYLRVGAEPGLGTDGTFDVCVRSIPCSTPLSATVTSTSQTNVNVVINGGVEGDTYIIEYGPQGHVPGADGTAGAGGTIVTTNTLNTNVAVAANANYTFYVRKDCSGASEGYSFNVGPYNVSTFIIVPASGSASITGCGLTVYDNGGDGDYSNSADGFLVINPSSSSQLVELIGTYSGIESCCDDLFIYEGAGTGGTVLGNFFGSGTFTIQASAPGVPLTVRFDTDVSAVGAGFEIQVNCLQACANPIIPGSVSASAATVCPTQTFTVELDNPALGYTYQWQRRTATTNWTNIAGATSSILTTTQSVASDYRCRVGCSFVGGSTTYASGFVSVGMNPFTACYCATTFDFGTTDDDWISNVTLGSINNSTGASASPYLTNYAPGAGTTTTLLRSGSYNGSVTVATAFGGLDVAVWIDFNRNGSFELSERVTQTGGQALDDGESATVSFTVPANASLGTTRMRVIADYFNGNIDPCGPLGFGEGEDYTVTIANGSANDNRASATAVNPGQFPACSNLSGNLANATPSAAGQGNDLWYSFVAESNAVRIQLTGSGDNLIELEDAAGTTIEEANLSGGSEVLANGTLTPGATYYVAIRNVSSPASFTVCIQTLAPSTCDNGPVYTSLCNTFKADWTGTANYVATFTETAAPFASYTANINGSTSIPLRNIAGLRHGRSYNVSVNAVYTFGAEVIIAQSTTTCPITITQHPLVNLRTADADPNTRTIGAFIGTDVLVCGNTDWEWTFELVDGTGAPIGVEGPVSVITGSTSRYIRTSQIPGVSAGNRYRVRVRPIFGAESGVFDDATFRYLQIAGSAGMVDAFDGEVAPEALLVERNTENGVFAALYPNPNNGDMVNLNIAGLDSESVQVRIFDATGRVVFSNRYVVEGALNTIVSFSNPLTAGMYIVEMTFGKEVITERMMVSK